MELWSACLFHTNRTDGVPSPMACSSHLTLSHSFASRAVLEASLSNDSSNIVCEGTIMNGSLLFSHSRFFFLRSIYLFKSDRNKEGSQAGKGHREEEKQVSIYRFSLQMAQTTWLDQAGPGSRNFIWVSCMGGRGPSSCMSSVAFPGAWRGSQVGVRAAGMLALQAAA